MAFILDGAATARLVRNAGLVASSAAFQFLFAVKRTSAQTGDRQLLALRKYGTPNDGHDVFLNYAGSGYSPVLSANWDTFSVDAGPIEPFRLNEWDWYALGGTSGTITMRQAAHGAGAWNSDSASQIAVLPTEMVIADDNSGTRNFGCKTGYIFEWNSERTSGELLAQIASANPIITTGLVSFKSGKASSLALALLGDVGSAFTQPGGVTIDGDGPVFGPSLTGTIQFPGTSTYELDIPNDPIITGSATGVATITVGGIDPDATELILASAPSLGGAPNTSQIVFTAYQVSAGEALSGVKVVNVAGHAPGSTWYYYAFVRRFPDQGIGTPWVAVTFSTTAVLVASEGPDVAAVLATSVNGITLICTEEGDFAVDADGPVVTLFAPATVTGGSYNVTISAADLTGVLTMRLFRGVVEIAIFNGPGPHTVTEAVTFADNGARAYHVIATDLAGNVTTTPDLAVTIAILQGAFEVILETSAASVTEPGRITLSVDVGSLDVDYVTFLLNGVALGQSVTQAPYSKEVQFLTSDSNGTLQYSALVVLADGSTGTSEPVTVVVNLPPAATPLLLISTGLAELMEIPRRDTSRAIVFLLTNDQTGLPLTGVTPRVQIAKESSAYEDPTGVVAEMAVAGHYVYWPSADDVNVEGRFSVSITATGAVPLPVIHARVVTPYGKR